MCIDSDSGKQTGSFRYNVVTARHRHRISIAHIYYRVGKLILSNDTLREKCIRGEISFRNSDFS